MRCQICGCEFEDDGRFCPNCGAPVAQPVELRGQVGQQAPRYVRRVLLVGGSALLVLVLALFLSWAFIWGEVPRARRAAEARDALCAQIDSGVQQCIKSYLNDEGNIDYDPDALGRAAQDVYDYAEELKGKGTIEGAAKCDAGYSVSFFLNDGTTHVYFPPIQDAMAGGGRSSVLTFNMLPDGVGYHLGFRDPGKIIKDTDPSTSWKEYDGDEVTCASLRDVFRNMGAQHPDAVFWFGHGGAYIADNGEVVFAFILEEKRSDETDFTYREEMAKRQDGGPALISTTAETYAITYRFIQRYLGTVDGGLFFTGSCFSAADQDQAMARALLDKGFDAYVGTSASINTLYSNEVMARTAENLVTLGGDGLYPTVDGALSEATQSCQDSLGDQWNDNPLLSGGGQFQIVGENNFRLFKPEITVQLNLDDPADAEHVSVWWSDLASGAEGFSGEKRAYSELEGGSFSIPIERMDGRQFEVGIGYDDCTLKTVTIGNIQNLIFEDNVSRYPIDVSVATLDVVVNDDQGRFVEDADVGVTATDNENGTKDVIQMARLTTNDGGDDIYRLFVAPGAYRVEVHSDTYGDAERPVGVTGDTVVRFGQSDPAAYAEVVQRYEDVYGPFTLYGGEYSSNYTGVFLLDLVDFDGDGVDELVIGYSVPHPGGIDLCAWPALDVWTLEGGEPVCVYEGASILGSDISKRCRYMSLDGTWYLVTGMDGSTVDLQLLAFENGSFSCARSLRMEEELSGAYVTGYTFTIDGTEVDEGTFSELLQRIEASRAYNGSLYPDAGDMPGYDYSEQDLIDAMNETRERIGMEPIS